MLGPVAMRIGAAYVEIAVIAVLDYVTGPELALWVFYVAPVAAIAWLGGRRSACLVNLGTW